MKPDFDQPAPTTVRFENAFFRANADGFFRLDGVDRRPAYVFNLGDQVCVISLQSIRDDRHVDDNSADRAMLDVVGEALKFVREIRIGDPLSSEIVTGAASWQPAAHHRALAHRRVIAAMIKWTNAQGGARSGPGESNQGAGENADRKTIAEALRRLAEAVDGVDDSAGLNPALLRFAAELSYIEALRETVERIRRIGEIFEIMLRVGGGQANNTHEVASVQRVFHHMMRLYDQILASVDERLLDIGAAAAAPEALCEHICSARNRLRSQLLAWEVQLDEWEQIDRDNIDIVAVAPKIGELYRFLAPQYSPVDEWVRLRDYQKHLEQIEAAKASAGLPSAAGAAGARPIELDR